MPRTLLFLLSLLMLFSAPARADDEFGDLSRGRPAASPAPSPAAPRATDAGELSDDGRKVGGTIVGQQVGFVMGRDNLAFNNLYGAISLGGMAGNCYAMAVVAKLMFEHATYEPHASGGLNLSQMAAAMSEGGRITVKGYRSLHDLSNEPGFRENDVFEYTARVRGMKPGDPEPPELSERQKQVAQLMQVVSTVHFLHYMQYQAGHFLEAILRSKLAGSGEIQRLTLREMDTFASTLQGGKTQILLMLETKEVFGHVVLATRMTRTPTADYIEIYDSNVQYAGETRPSVLKIGKDGKMAGYFMREADGRLTANNLYAGDSWWENRDTLAIIALPDHSLENESGRSLARKLASADVETAYLIASGALLKSLSEKSPAEESLRTGVSSFVRKVLGIQSSLGRDFGTLPADADVQTVNLVLEQRSDLAFRAAFPFGLPRGISLTDTRIQLDPNDPNKASMKTTITLEKDSPVGEYISVVQRSVALAEYPRQAEWIQSVIDNVGPTKVRTQLEFTLTKQELPANGRSKYGLLPTLERSHIVLGDLVPSTRIEAPHMLEISEKTLQGGLDVALRKLGIIDHTYRFQYDLSPGYRTKRHGWIPPLTLAEPKHRHGTITLQSLTIDCAEPNRDLPGGALRLNGNSQSFVACNPFNKDLGVNVTTRPATAELTINRNPADAAGVWNAETKLRSTLTVDDGTFRDTVSRALAKLADVAFPFFATRINDQIRVRLADYAELTRPFKIENLDISITECNVDITGGAVDLRRLGKRMFAVDSPVTLMSAATKDDRLIFGCKYLDR